MIRTITLFLVLSFTGLANAKSVPSPCDGVIPEIDAIKAIQIATMFLANIEHKNDLQVERVLLKCDSSNLVWHIGINTYPKHSSLTFVLVSMSGHATIGYKNIE